jgi:DNA-binding transcriptional LysR family regulator
VELRQIEHFLAVVEEGSFTRAAARSFMVQSSLSASLLTLERELGTELFIRGRRGAELTDAGRAFLEPARAALAAAGQARDAVAAVQGLLRGSIAIAAVAMPGSVDLVPTIRRFRSEHPGVDVRVVPVGAQQMVDLVADGQVDFAIAPRIHRMSSALRFESLVSTPLVVVCPTGHRLAGAQGVEVSELIHEAIVDLPRGWRARELFDGLLEAAGLQRRAGFEIDDWLAMLTMVQRGTGISYGPGACIDTGTFRGIATATLADAPSWELGILSCDGTLRGAAGRAFLAAYLDDCRARRTA